MTMATANSANSHRWKFFRAGGVDQVQLRDGKDIANLGLLDQKLWMALAVGAGNTLGLGRWWTNTSLVRRHGWLT